MLSATEALERLDLLADISRVLDTNLEDYAELTRRVVHVCVPAFADLSAVELIGPGGEPTTVAYEVADGTGLAEPEQWPPISFAFAKGAPELCFAGHEHNEVVAELRRSLGAESMVVVPIMGGGITVGRLVAATGPSRRAFRPSALRMGTEVASRLAGALERTTLQREMKAASAEQARAVRRLRHLATSAAKLAGAATTQEVLHIACLEAKAIQEARGAVARWWMPDGSVVEARVGHIDEALADEAFDATAGRRVARDNEWVAYPLLPNLAQHQAAMVVFGGLELCEDQELVLASLASLVPVAFERAIGTGAAMAQEARVRAIVNSSPVALVGFEPTGAVTLANPTAERLFGWEGTPGQGPCPPASARRSWNWHTLSERAAVRPAGSCRPNHSSFPCQRHRCRQSAATSTRSVSWWRPAT